MGAVMFGVLLNRPCPSLISHGNPHHGVQGTLERLYTFFVSAPRVLRYSNEPISRLSVTRLNAVQDNSCRGAWPSHTALSLASNAPTSPVQKRNSQHSAGKTVSFFYWLAIDTPMSLPMYSEQIHTRKRRIVTLRLLYRPAPIIAFLC